MMLQRLLAILSMLDFISINMGKVIGVATTCTHSIIIIADVPYIPYFLFSSPSLKYSSSFPP